MTRRREFSPKTKAAAFLRAHGNCQGCGRRLLSGEAEYDHIVADWLGGSNALENCTVLCKGCHRWKTSNEDVPRIAKTKRQGQRTAGIKRDKSGQKLPGGKDSKWKRTIDGRTVLR